MKVLSSSFLSVDLPIPACRITIERLNRGKVVLLPCTNVTHGDVFPCVVGYKREVFPQCGIDTVYLLHALVVVHGEDITLDDGLEFFQALTALLEQLGVARSHRGKL